MRLRVLLFGPAAGVAGAGEVELDLPEGSPVERVNSLLAERFPALRPLLDRSRYAVNETFVDANHAVRGGDEVAVIPPVSGG